MNRGMSSEDELKLSWEFRRDNGRWESIRVPAPWQQRHPDFHGTGEYRARLTREDDGPFFLRFEGVATKAHLSVNGLSAGTHIGAWTPFTIDITPHLHAEKARPNELLLRVDELPDHFSGGFLFAIGRGFGGIWGRVSRVRTASTIEEQCPSCAKTRPDH